MALMSLAEQRASVAGSSSHAGVHLSARRATNAAEVEEQNARHRPVFAIPADTVSCLYASLRYLRCNYRYHSRHTCRHRAVQALL